MVEMGEPNVEGNNKRTENMDKKHTALKICTFNIQHGAGARLEQAARCLKTMGIDMAILTETKLQGIHTTQCEGYEITATIAKSRFQGGIALCTRKSSRFHVEGTRTWGPNVISTTLVSGRKKWKVVGAYIPPGEQDTTTIEFIQAATETTMPLILLGDLNTDLRGNNNANTLKMETEAMVAALGVVNLSSQYKQRKGTGNWTWHQMRQGNHITATCDHILTTDARQFTYMKIKTPRFDSDHRMLVAGLDVDTETQERKYVAMRSKPQIDTNPQNANAADKLMEEIKMAIPKPPKKPDHRYQSWISEDTWKAIDAKAEARRCGDTQKVLELKKVVRNGIRRDRMERINKTATTIENLLQDGKVQEAYTILRHWYRDRAAQPPKPTLMDAAKTRAEYEKLYTEQRPSEPAITIHTQPAEVNDATPTEDEIKKAVKRMRLGKAPGATAIRTEHLRKWMEEAETDKDSGIQWKKVVDIVQRAFEGQPLPSSFGTGILVLIPKGEPDQFRGIALLEVIYKLVSTIINARLGDAIKFHKAVHGFRRGRGTTTAIAELKLVMRANRQSNKPLFMIFLDLKKAYDTLDRDRTLQIMRGYGVGPNICNIIAQTWAMDKMVPKQAGFYAEPFATSRGVRQGDIMSPTVFNIVCDAIIRHCENKTQCQGLKAIFYADDGVLIGRDPAEVQKFLDIYTEAFASVGLQMNVAKTKSMTMSGRKSRAPMSTSAYRRKATGEGISFAERMKTKATCPLCDTEVQSHYLKTHQQTRKCLEIWRRKKDETRNQPTVEGAEERGDEQVAVMEPTTYMVSVNKSDLTPCPAPDCPYTTHLPQRMRLHFKNMHNSDTIVIREEGPLPRCSNCGIFQKDVGLQHKQSEACKSATMCIEIRRSQKENEQMAESTVFTVKGNPIERVSEFKYLGRMITETDDDWCAVNRNLKRAQATWARVRKLLAQEKKKSPKAAASIYKAVVQAILLYGSETWAVTTQMEHKLEVFHRRCARSITGQHIHPNPDGTWHYPNTQEVFNKIGLEPIQQYIDRRQRNIKNYLNPRSETVKDIKKAIDLDFNLEKAIWWKPENPIQDPNLA
jgi:exonuclease III